MTTLTDQGLILIAPPSEPAEILYQLQFQNFQAFMKQNQNAVSDLAWMTAAGVEDFE